jgi:hypothetical protein
MWKKEQSMKSKSKGPEHIPPKNGKRVEPNALSAAELLRICRRRSKPWIKSRKWFNEFLERVKQGRIPNVRTQAEACRAIGCSLRWMQMIIAGTAADSNKHKKTRREVDVAALAQSDEDYANDIARYAQRKLQLLMTQDPPRFSEIYQLLEES